MSNHTVIDASAVMALLNNEKGCDLVEAELDKAIISSVNFAEVLTVANRSIFENKKSREEGIKLLRHTFPKIINFDYEQACISAELDELTKKHGLSLGDRACLALAKYKNCSVLTADKAWKKLDVGIKIKLIR